MDSFQWSRRSYNKRLKGIYGFMYSFKWQKFDVPQRTFHLRKKQSWNVFPVPKSYLWQSLAIYIYFDILVVSVA